MNQVEIPFGVSQQLDSYWASLGRRWLLLLFLFLLVVWGPSKHNPRSTGASGRPSLVHLYAVPHECIPNSSMSWGCFLLENWLPIQTYFLIIWMQILFYYCGNWACLAASTFGWTPTSANSQLAPVDTHTQDNSAVTLWYMRTKS